jgi:predicted GH43/DUF377 family glycosyl hydrolase
MVNEKSENVQDVAPEEEAEIPVNPDVITQMKIDVSVNQSSRVFVFHDKPFPKPLEWAEYDAEDARLVFITKGGFLNDFGMDINSEMQKYIENAEYLEAFLIKDNETLDYANVRLFVRKTLH